MVDHALDYSAGVPSGATVKNSGYAGVLRYLKKTGSSGVHVLTSAEYADMKSHGVGVELVYEDKRPSRMLNGFNAGANDAVWAKSQAQAVGISSPRCIYFTADFDVQPGQYAPVRAYLDGAASVLGITVTGLYGGYKAIVNCGSHASWLWQTSAWSGGLLADGAHVIQNLKQVVIGGITCDVNTLLTDDWGQHPAPASTPPIDPPPATEGLPDMLIARPTSPGTYLLVSGAGVTVLLDSESVSALVHAGVPEATLSDADFNRLKALVQ